MSAIPEKSLRIATSLTMTDPRSDVVLVGERANDQPEGRSSRLRSALEVRLMRSAFCHGPSRNKLVSLGARWSMALNLRPALPTREATWNKEDREGARDIVLDLLSLCADRGLKVLAVGSRPAQAFNLYGSAELGSFSVTRLPGVDVAVIPHPSGRNFVWNNPANVDRAKEFLKEYCGTT